MLVLCIVLFEGALCFQKKCFQKHFKLACAKTAGATQAILSSFMESDESAHHGDDEYVSQQTQAKSASQNTGEADTMTHEARGC